MVSGTRCPCVSSCGCEVVRGAAHNGICVFRASEEAYTCMSLYRVFHAKLDIRKRCHFASKNAKIILKKRFKEHLTSDFLCKNFMGLGQKSWPQHQFEVK